eukprot:3291226-Rhodomonas_salina.1
MLWDEAGMVVVPALVSAYAMCGTGLPYAGAVLWYWPRVWRYYPRVWRYRACECRVWRHDAVLTSRMRRISVPAGDHAGAIRVPPPHPQQKLMELSGSAYTQR